MPVERLDQIAAPATAESGAPGGGDHSSWSRMYAARRAAARQLGPLWGLPLVRRASRVVLASVQPGSRVLEIGAGDRRLAPRIAARNPGGSYESLDPDPALFHDYRSLDEVAGPYDLIVALEVVEHLPLAELREWLPRVVGLLSPGGRLVLSTPNTFYPPAYLRDATHQTPLCYDELAGLVTLAGGRVEQVWRVQHDPWPTAWVRRWACGWLFRLLGIDYARQIVLRASRAEVP